MANKSNEIYFDNFISCAKSSCEAAEMLKGILENYDISKSTENLDALHEIEHKADKKRHDMMQVLVKAFITPIEREDIIKLSRTIDNVTDSIEDIMIQIHIAQLKEIREDAIIFVDLMNQCCNAMVEILKEFKNFKKSQNIADLIIQMNSLEEKGDRHYLQSMHDLHANCTDPLEIIVWREIYKYFEKVCDACEDVGDIVESILIENM